VSNGKVSFTYKDYPAGAVQKLMSLEANEFLRRFCMHILPKRFEKIRHYGYLSSRNKAELKMHQLQIGVLLEVMESKTSKERRGVAFSQNAYRCPYCKTETMIRIMSFDANAPPQIYENEADTKIEVKK